MARASKFERRWGISGLNYMVSRGSASGQGAEAKSALRIGVIGAGIMGSNHARVLAGLPDATLVGIVDPLPEHRLRATETGLFYFEFQAPNRFKTHILDGTPDDLRWNRVDGRVWVQT